MINLPQSMALRFPDYTGNSVYNLACGIADFLGVRRDCIRKREIAGRRIALVLLDGGGCEILKFSGINSVEAERNCLTTVFPSSTSTVITTLFTAMTPGEHGILGYSNYSKVLGSIVNPLRFSTPYSAGRDSLKDYSSFSRVFPNVKGFLTEVSKDKRTAEVIPKGIEQTEFTLATHGRTSITKTYLNVWDAYQEATNVLNEGYDFVYIYVPDIDAVAHKNGPYSETTVLTVREVWEMVTRLAQKFKNYTFYITADHGLVHVTNDVLLNSDQELLRLLEVPPYGDSRAIMLKSRRELREYLKAKFPNLEVFHSQEDMVKLFGRISDSVELPDYVLVPRDSSAYLYAFREKQQEEIGKLKGHHGGLSDEEMRVPLVVLNT
jgi:predicted AlkP superfamily pyrophosphatase or phosphodiesterase